MDDREFRVKVAYIVTKGDVGGAQKYVLDLVNKIDKQKFDPIIVKGRDGEEVDGVSLKWLSNDFKPYLFFYNDVLALIELVVFLYKLKPGVVHLNSSKAGVIGSIAAKIAGVKKVVFTAHGWVFSDEELSFVKRYFYILLHKIAGYFQDVIINVSEYDKKLALRKNIAPDKKLKVIWNGIDLDKNVLEKNEAREEIVKIIGEVKTKKWIGSIGRLVKEKNYKILVEAAKNVDANFFIIGEGYEREKLEKEIKKNNLEDRFFLVGEMDCASRYLKAFDTFVLPSRKEGLPYTLIEVMASKIPVVVSNIGGMPEIIEGRGEIFKNGNVDSLSQSLNIIDDRYIEKAFEFAKNNLDIEKVVNRVEDIYTI